MFSILVLQCITILVSVDSQLGSETIHSHTESIIHRESFLKVARADRNFQHEIVIAVKKKNLDLIEKIVAERSTPGHSLYQQWLTFDEVTSMTKDPDATAAVETWLSLEGVGVTWRSVRSDYLKVTASVSFWEKTFKTEFYTWEDREVVGQVSRHIRAETCQLPSFLVDHIAAVFNTCQAPPVISSHHVRKSSTSDFKTSFTIDDPTVHLRGGELENFQTKNNRKLSSSCVESNGAVTVGFLDCYYDIDSNIGNALKNCFQGAYLHLIIFLTFV